MRQGLEDVFDRLEPPPGGEALLLSRIRASTPRRRAWVWGGVSFAAAAACGLFLLLRPPSSAPITDNPALARFGMLDPAADGIQILPASRGVAAAIPLPSSDPNVLIYAVAVVGSGEGDDAEAP